MQLFYYSDSTTMKLNKIETVIGSEMLYYDYKEPASLFYGI